MLSSSYRHASRSRSLFQSLVGLPFRGADLFKYRLERGFCLMIKVTNVFLTNSSFEFEEGANTSRIFEYCFTSCPPGLQVYNLSMDEFATSVIQIILCFTMCLLVSIACGILFVGWVFILQFFGFFFQ